VLQIDAGSGRPNHRGSPDFFRARIRGARREAKGRLIIGFGGSAMARATQFTIGRGMIAIAIIGYFCAFRELAVLLGIFVASLLFVSPVFVVSYLALRFLLRNHRPANPRL
jgi:hypothetical protein